jgi:hypothetical protein
VRTSDATHNKAHSPVFVEYAESAAASSPHKTNQKIPMTVDDTHNDAADGTSKDAILDAAAGTNLSDEQTNDALAALQEASNLSMFDEAHITSTLPKDGNEEEEKAMSENAKKKRKVDNNITTTTTAVASTTRPRSTPVRVTWDDRLDMLQEYRNEHGNLLIPIRYKLNPSLGKFVHNTREQYKLFHNKCKVGYKKKCSLTGERIAQLEELGFVFSTERGRRQNMDWESRFEQLKRYKKMHGVSLILPLAPLYTVCVEYIPAPSHASKSYMLVCCCCCCCCRCCCLAPH